MERLDIGSGVKSHQRGVFKLASTFSTISAHGLVTELGRQVVDHSSDCQFNAHLTQNLVLGLPQL